jgi:hypothetical protein
MCPKHWAMVPPDIQQRVYDGYNEMKRGKGDAAYFQAITDAEISIMEQENKQQLKGVYHAV